MMGGMAQTFGLGIVLSALNRASGPIKEANKDFKDLELAFRRGKATIGDVISAGYFNRELKLMSAGVVALGTSLKLAADAAPIEMAQRNLQTLGFTAGESAGMLQSALDISRKPYILAGWNDLLDSAFDIKSALGSIGTSGAVRTAMDTVALLSSGSPEKDSVEDLKNAWIGFFQAYGKHSKNIQADSGRFADIVTAVNNEFQTTNRQIAATFAQSAIGLSSNNQQLETAIALVGALNETMGDQAGTAANALFRELAQSYEKIKKAGVDIAPGGYFLQFPEMVRQLQRVIPGLGSDKMPVASRQRLTTEFQLSAVAVEALTKGAAMLYKVENVLNNTELKGTAQRAASLRVQGSYTKAIADFKEEVQALRYELGMAAIPAMTKFTHGFTESVKEMREFHTGLGASRSMLHYLSAALILPGATGFVLKLAKLTGVLGSYTRALSILKSIGATPMGTMGAVLGGGILLGTVIDQATASGNPYGLTNARINELAKMTDDSGRKMYLTQYAAGYMANKELENLTPLQQELIARKLSKWQGSPVTFADYMSARREKYLQQYEKASENPLDYMAMLKPILDIAAPQNIPAPNYYSGDLNITVMPRANESDVEFAERVAEETARARRHMELTMLGLGTGYGKAGTGGVTTGGGGNASRAR